MGGTSARVRGDREVDRELKALRDRARNLAPAFEAFGRAFRAHEERAFASEGATAGGRWAPLSPGYAAWKIRKVGTKPILQFSGRLKDSFTRADHPDHINEIGPRTARYGSRVPYGPYHQSTKPRTRLPHRPPLVVTRELQSEANRLMKNWVLDGDTA